MAVSNQPTDLIRQKLSQVRDELSARYLERDEVITGVLIGALTGQHVFLLGPPGTAKTALIRSFAERIVSSSYWGQLCTKFSAPEEFVGAPSLAAMREDRGLIRRKEGTLRTAHFAMLDEIFKASTAIRSCLLTILNERIYYESGKEQTCPLVMAMLASNELPSDSEDHAFWDRVLQRFTVSGLKSKGAIASMLTGAGAGDQKTTVSLKELIRAQQEVVKVKMPKSVADLAATLFMKLREEGFDVSERAMMQAAGDVSPIDGARLPSLVKASAWLNGYDEVTEEDFVVLSNCFWRRPEEQKRIREIVFASTSPTMETLNHLRIKGTEIVKLFEEAKKERDNSKIAELFVSLNQVVKQADALQTKFARDKRLSGAVEAFITSIKDSQEEMMAIVQGKTRDEHDTLKQGRMAKARQQAFSRATTGQVGGGGPRQG